MRSPQRHFAGSSRRYTTRRSPYARTKGFQSYEQQKAVMARLAETNKLIHSEAWKAARRYRIQDHEDLVSAGQEAVIKFAQRYDPKRGAQFITGAHQAIRAGIAKEAARSHLVRVPEKQLGKVTRAQKLPQRMSLSPALEATAHELATHGGIDSSEHKLALRSLSKNLSPQQLKVVKYNLQGYNHAEIAKRMRISATRAQRMYNQAIKKMQAQAKAGKYSASNQ